VKLFDGRGGISANARALIAARAHAMAGGQALHLWEPKDYPDHRKAPLVFRNSPLWAHLFDQDLVRLKETCETSRVRVVVADRVGTPSQHIDLCAGPLERALAECTE